MHRVSSVGRFRPWPGRISVLALTALVLWAFDRGVSPAMFLSHTHAGLLSYAYIGHALHDWRVLLKSGQPPLPLLWAMFFPYHPALTAGAALAAGILALGLVRRLCRRGAGFGACAGYMAVLFTSPAFLYLATQDLVRSLTLALALSAWYHFARFTLGTSTWAGFLSGLLFAITALASYEALFYALALAIVAPLFRQHEIRRWPRITWPVVALTFSLTLLYPIMAVLGAWAFLHWMIVGDLTAFYRYFVQFPSELRISPGTGPSWAYAFYTLWADWTRVPLFPVSTVLLARYAPRRLWISGIVVATYLFLMRFWGAAYTPDSTQMLWLLVTIIHLPRRLDAHQRSWWALAVGLQLLANVGLWVVPSLWPPLPRHDLAYGVWLESLHTGQVPPAWRLESAVAQRLAQAPAHSILTDERQAYRLIALAGTAQPFVTSFDPYFASAARVPRAWVSYILLPDADAFTPASAWLPWDAPPPGFVLDAAWSGWICYRQMHSPSLFASP